MVDWGERDKGWLSVWEDKIWVCVWDEVGEYVTYGYECSKKRQFNYGSLLIRFYSNCNKYWNLK